MKSSDQHVFVCFFDTNELMPFQKFGPYQWADLEGLSIRALPAATEDEPDPEVVYPSHYALPGAAWSRDAPGEGWIALLGDGRFAYTDVSICPEGATTPYTSPKLTKDQIRRLNHNDQDVRESVQEEV